MLRDGGPQRFREGDSHASESCSPCVSPVWQSPVWPYCLSSLLLLTTPACHPRQASVMAKMDAARRDLLAATMECSPHVHVGKAILAAVTKFARLEHVPEAITPRDFGVDWKTPAKADLPRM